MKKLFFFLLLLNLLFYLGAQLYIEQPAVYEETHGGGNIQVLANDELKAYRQREDELLKAPTASAPETDTASKPPVEAPAEQKAPPKTEAALAGTSETALPETESQESESDLKPDDQPQIDPSAYDPPDLVTETAEASPAVAPEQTESNPTQAAEVEPKLEESESDANESSDEAKSTSAKLPTAETPDADQPETDKKVTDDTLVERTVAEAEKEEQQRKCLSIGPLQTRNLAKQLADEFANQNMAGTLRRDTENEVRNYLVMIPSKSGDEASELARKLRAAGHTDVWWLTTGDQKGNVSVGIFRERRNAAARKNEMRQQGFGAEVVPRYVDREYFWVDLRESGSKMVDPTLMEKLRGRYPKIGADPIRCPHSPL